MPLNVSLPLEITSYISTVLPRTEGWCSPEKAELLAATVLTKRPQVAIEIGVFAGRSLFAIALALRANNTGHALGIDPWNAAASIEGWENDAANRDWWSRCDHDYIYREFLRFRGLLGLDDWASPFVGTSRQAVCALNILRAARGNLPFIDLLHIDGNHSQEHALFDVETYVPHVTAGGSVFFDDCDWSTTKSAQAVLANYCEQTGMVANCGVFTRVERQP